MRIDAHQHFWRYDARLYPWISPAMEVLRRDYLPEDLRPHVERYALGGTVAVQARSDVAETRWLLECADAHPWILGVVGWVDLCADDVQERLAELTRHPKLKGIRHVVQDEPDDGFMRREDFRWGLARLEIAQLTYDLLIHPRHLPAAIELARQFPEQPFVVDHLAKPLIRERQREPWEAHLRELGRLPNVACKVSGLVTEAAADWGADDLRFYLDHALACFGEERLLYGSDWPVCRLAAEYDRVIDVTASWADSRLTAPARQKLFGLNAARFYRLGP